jgi:hypothetical protein
VFDGADFLWNLHNRRTSRLQREKSPIAIGLQNLNFTNAKIASLCSKFSSSEICSFGARKSYHVTRGAIGKFQDCYCCHYERRWDGKTESDFNKPIASVCHMTPRCQQAWFSYECFFVGVSFCRQRVAKGSNKPASSPAWSLVNSLPKPFKCFVRLLENVL